VAGHGVDELLTGTGAGDGDVVVGPRARADHRRVADTAGQLPSHPARRGRRRELPVRVERDRADGPMPWGIRARACVRGRRIRMPGALAFGHEPGRILELEAGVGRVALGPGRDEQHVRRLLHDRTGERHRVAYARHARAGSGLAGGAVHDGGVHLHAAVGGEHRTAAGVEERAFLERADGRLNGVERRSSGREQLVAREEPVAQGAMVRGLVVDLSAARVAGASVYEQDGSDFAHDLRSCHAQRGR
jgi:hypothetical protein